MAAILVLQIRDFLPSFLPSDELSNCMEINDPSAHKDTQDQVIYRSMFRALFDLESDPDPHSIKNLLRPCFRVRNIE